jgi:hypothetical protein
MLVPAPPRVPGDADILQQQVAVAAEVQPDAGETVDVEVAQ